MRMLRFSCCAVVTQEDPPSLSSTSPYSTATTSFANAAERATAAGDLAAAFAFSTAAKAAALAALESASAVAAAAVAAADAAPAAPPAPAPAAASAPAPAPASEPAAPDADAAAAAAREAEFEPFTRLGLVGQQLAQVQPGAFPTQTIGYQPPAAPASPLSTALGVGLIPFGPLINNSSSTKYLNLLRALLMAG